MASHDGGQENHRADHLHLSFYTIAWLIRAIQRRRQNLARRRGDISTGDVTVDPVAEPVAVHAVQDLQIHQDPYLICYGKLRFHPNWVLKPWSKRLVLWLSVVSTAVMYNLLTIFPRSAFEEQEPDRALRTACIVLDYCSDVIYVCDIFFSVLTGYLDNGVIVTEPRKLWDHYRRSRKFKLDLLSIFPTDFLFIYTGTDVPCMLFRLNRLLKLPRLNEFIYRTETRSDNPLLVRISVLLGALIVSDKPVTSRGSLFLSVDANFVQVMTHINGCVYYFVSHLIRNYGLDGGSDRWSYPGTAKWKNDEEVKDSLYRKWSYSFYWSAMMLTSVLPNMPNPYTNWEIIFHCFEIFFGMLFFATIVARISSMIFNINKKRDIFKSKEEGVKTFMTNHKEIGPAMEKRVLKWFDYIWRTKQDLDEDSVLTLLPESLKIEIARVVHLDVLKKVKLFQDVDEQFLDELIIKLKFQPFSPGDYICRKGDIGRQMYVVRRGKLDVVSDDGMKVFATLGAGTVFGELSILNIAGSKNGNRRTANVRAVGYADLFSLSKEDLWESLKEYPAVRDSLLEKACQILKRDDLLDEQAAIEQARRNRDFPGVANQIESNLVNLDAHIAHTMEEYNEAARTLEEELLELDRDARLLRRYNRQSFQRIKDPRRAHSAGDMRILEEEHPL